QLATGSEVTVIEGADSYYTGAVFSPDGNFLYYLHYSATSLDLYSVPSLGGSPRRVLSDLGSPISFSPDGRHFAFRRRSATHGCQVVIAAADGSSENAIYSSVDTRTFIPSPSWSPDLGLIAVASSAPNSAGVLSDIAVIDPKGNLKKTFA